MDSEQILYGQHDRSAIAKIEIPAKLQEFIESLNLRLEMISGTIRTEGSEILNRAQQKHYLCDFRLRPQFIGLIDTDKGLLPADELVLQHFLTSEDGWLARTEEFSTTAPENTYLTALCFTNNLDMMLGALEPLSVLSEADRTTLAKQMAKE